LHTRGHPAMPQRLLISQETTELWPNSAEQGDVHSWNRMSGNGQEKGFERASEKADTWLSIRLRLLPFCYCPDGAAAGTAFAICFSGCDGTLKCNVIPHSASCIVET
jgi:hypothetical protein